MGYVASRFPSGSLGLLTNPFESYPSGSISITSSWAYPTAVGAQLSVGGIVEDLGEWVRTTTGELLKVVVDFLGRRIIEKTGEVLATTPLGPATAYPYAQRQAGQLLPWVIGGGLVALGLILFLR